MKKSLLWLIFVSALLVGALFVSCSNGSDSAPIVGMPVITTGAGTTTTPTPTPPTTYTITFNANDGSQNPATKTQTFTDGEAQALKTVAELGFKKDGFNFAGWLTAPDASEATYADGASYTATVAATLYAKWSAVPVYGVNIPFNEHGTVTATPAIASAGTEITLSATPKDGYELASYTVTAVDGTIITVTNGKFTMPAQKVTVAASFSTINYTVACGPFTNGDVSANLATAAAGAAVILTISPSSGYCLSALAVTAADGITLALNGTGSIRTFTMPAKSVTVTATFVVLPQAAYTQIGTTTINGTQYDLVTFGLWPQTIKADSVTVNENETLVCGNFTYCKGSDGQWYVKQVEKAYESGCKYSDNTDVAQGGTSYKWFKVEPIKWRVLTQDYNKTGKKLLLAENILIGKRYAERSNNYQNSEIRKWLNSNVNSEVASDYGDSKGFLKTAFTAAQIATIADTSVVNSERSANPADATMMWNNGVNQYASNTPTTDKVFLLSVQEATTNTFGFDVYKSSGAGNVRIRQNTDFAKASGAYQSTSAGMGGYWWLRSPQRDYAYGAHDVLQDGKVLGGAMESSIVGVVPALCVE